MMLHHTTIHVFSFQRFPEYQVQLSLSPVVHGELVDLRSGHCNSSSIAACLDASDVLIVEQGADVSKAEPNPACNRLCSVCAQK